MKSSNKFMNWKVAGILLGALSILAVVTVKPIGVSTQYVVADGMVIKQIMPEMIIENAYFAKYVSKFETVFSYSFMLVVGLLVGGLVSRFTGGKSSENKQMPVSWKNNFGGCPATRSVGAFIGGVLVLFGARLAGGCTSGHIVSGIGQLAISGFVFAIAVFAVGIPVAKFIYKK